MSESKKVRAADRLMILDDMLVACERDQANTLESWNSFADTIQIPRDFLPAMLTNREELLNLAPPRAMTAEEAAVLYRLVSTLIVTNQRLRQHAEKLSQMVDNWCGAFAHLRSLGDRIQRFGRYERDISRQDDEIEMPAA